MKRKPLGASTIRKGRDGDINVPLGQTSMSLKRRVTQARGLLSLKRQLKARQQQPSAENHMQCTMLWNATCTATGFPHGFQSWVLHTVGWFVPTGLPDLDYVEALYQVFHEDVMEDVRVVKSEQMRKFSQITLENLAKGGGMAFKAVKDKAAPLPTFITQTVQQNLLRQRWSIHGTTRLRFSPPCVLEVGMPVVFHGQDAVLADVDGTFLHLDRPVVCKHDLDLVVTQPRLEASHPGMQKACLRCMELFLAGTRPC